MNLKDLQPASNLARRFGVKAVVYGGPGTGKTPMVQTAPRPVMCVVEPGMMTMRNVKNVPVWEAKTPEKIEEFFTWALQSNEAKQFDTIAIDSVSQMAELFLKQEMSRCKDGRKAYGNMADRVMSIFEALNYMPEKHIYLVTKAFDKDVNGSSTKRPLFPGQDLNYRVPHLFDEVWYLSRQQVQGHPLGEVITLRSKETFGILARDRSGMLSELEYPDVNGHLHLNHLFSKCMS